MTSKMSNINHKRAKNVNFVNLKLQFLFSNLVGQKTLYSAKSNIKNV